MKRILSEGYPYVSHEISAQADLLALRALQASREGELNQAFTLLRVANDTGARSTLCRRAVFGILSQINHRDRVLMIRYGLGRVRSIEVGRIRESGFVLLADAPTAGTTKIWQPEVQRSFDPGKLALRTESEFKADILAGLVRHRRLGKGPIALRHIDWEYYLEGVGDETPSKISPAFADAA